MYKCLISLHRDLDLKEIFPRQSITTVYRRQKNLREMLAPSSYPKSVNSQVNIMMPSNSCDVCKHYLVAKVKFTSKVKSKTHFIKRDLSYNRKNVIYLITCDKCKDKFIGFAVDFGPRFRVHKSDIKTKKEHCVTSRHFNEDCLCSTSPFPYVTVTIVKQVCSEDPSKTEEVLWYRENIGKGNYSVTREMNSVNELYSKKHKGYRK